ncbi:MAG: hypothetical protein PHW03_07350 [Eubacteriales bacterium]|nr:hypothetical protein [Eubacteriales bacterium]
MSFIEIIKNPYVIIALCIAFILLSKFIFKINYMNCGTIIINHKSIFCNRDGKLLIIPFITYNILPIFVALGVNSVRVIDDSTIGTIIIILSILTSMLFTLLVMIIDMKGKRDYKKSQNGSQENIIRKLIIETYYTLMFEILIAVSVLFLSFVYLFADKISIIVSWAIYSLIFLLVFNLFIVLKRIFNIVQWDLST